MRKKVIIAAGGTAGHLYPAMQLALDLNDYDVHFMAKGLKTNKRFDQNAFSFTDISSAPIGLKGCFHIPKGVLQSLWYLRSEKPSVVIGFGSYHSFPVLVAAKLLGIPIIIHEANRLPGRVNRIFSKYACFTGAFFPDTPALYRVKHSDIPHRKPLQKPFWPMKGDAYNRYGLNPDKMTILVFGGSLGAKKLNEIAAEGLARFSTIQVLHLTGNSEQVQPIEKIYKRHSVDATVLCYEEKMAYAWQVADIVVSRAGAVTISEQLAFGVPAFFVPFPYAQDLHQDKNASFVVEHVKGARMMKESALTSERLFQEVSTIIENQDLYRKNIEQFMCANKPESFSQLVLHTLNEIE